MSSFLTVAGVWIAAMLTLFILSFLFKDSSFYRFAEHLVVGLSAGYWFVILWQTVFLDLIFRPILTDLKTARFLPPDPALANSAGAFGLILDGIPIVLGIMMWLRFFPKTAAYARIPIAFVLGQGAGLSLPTALQAFVVSPVYGTLILPIVPTSWQVWVASLFGASAPAGEPVSFVAAVQNLLIVAGVSCGVVYFFFSKEHKGVTGRVADFGVWVLMIGFGSTFGFTVMSRVSLLVGRFEFLKNKWLIENFWNLLFR